MRKYDIGYFSSADRGLDTLLSMIPKIEEKLGRKITSVWAYGWNTFDKFHAKNPERMKWKYTIIRDMGKVGMEAKGRLSHEELAKLMENTDVWAYPTAFMEIHCITALKAQAAGCRPVTSGTAALRETVWYDEQDIADMDENPAAQAAFIDRAVEILSTPRNEAALSDHAKKVIASTNWAEVAKGWDKALS